MMSSLQLFMRAWLIFINFRLCCQSDMVWAMKSRTIIRTECGQEAIQRVSWIWVAMSINMRRADIKHKVRMKSLPKCRATNPGGEAIFSFHNRFCSAPGMVSSHPFWSTFSVWLCMCRCIRKHSKVFIRFCRY